MTTQPECNEEGEWFGPVVEIWIDNTNDSGQTILVSGTNRTGDRFAASFYQPPDPTNRDT